MSKTVDIQLDKLKFPPECVVCMSPASKSYKLSRVFTYGRTSITVNVQAPMCDLHFQNATQKSPTEKLVGTVGLVIGALVGIFTIVALLIYWSNSGQGNLILNLFSSSILGLGLFLIVWMIFLLGIAPLFAWPDSKEARNAVRLKKYWPKDKFLQLEFERENLADIVAKESNAQ